MLINEREFFQFEGSLNDRSKLGTEFNQHFNLNDPYLDTETNFQSVRSYILKTYVLVVPSWVSSNDIAR